MALGGKSQVFADGGYGFVGMDETGSNCLVNIWIPDVFKDVPADRLTPRLRFKESLDRILACGYDRSKVTVCVESKVFGIGVESYTVGNSEFYQNYAAKNGICCLLDNGHYHPTEVVSDKIPSMLAFYDTVALHVTRPVRWDSDHVVLYEDELKEIAKEIIRNDAEKKVRIGLDYFDATKYGTKMPRCGVYTAVFAHRISVCGRRRSR